MEVTVDHICKNYGKQKALCDIQFRLTGGVYALLGPNGAGKSTLIKILTGNLPADGGEILWNGVPIQKCEKTYKDRLGYVPQQQAMYPELSAEEFLGYICALRGIGKKEAGERIAEVLNRVELAEERKKKIRAFSGGMKQRLLIAQALLGNPDFLILDEPTAGLDPRQRIGVKNLIAEVAADKIVLIATHIVSDIEYISREILLLSQGKLICQKPGRELLEEVNGIVWEIGVSRKEYDAFCERCRIVSTRPEEDFFEVRFLAQGQEVPAGARRAQPQLEDVYLYYFGE